MSNRFVFVSAVCPYPADSGKKVFIDGFLKYVIDKLGAENVHYFLLGKIDEEVIKIFREKYNINVVCLGVIATREVLRNTFLSLFLSPSKSFQECMLYSRTIKRTLFNKIQEFDPSVVVVDTVRIGQYFEAERPNAAKYVMYMEDLFSVRYKRMLMSSKKQGTLNAAGNFISNVPKIFRGILKSKSFEKLILGIELKRIAVRENYLPEKFDLNMLLSQNDVYELRKTTSKVSVIQVSPRLQIKTGIERRWEGEPIFVFIGDLKVSENSVSLECFIEKCMPQIIRRIPNFKLIIIGKGIPSSLRKQVVQFKDNMEYLGFVEDIDTIFACCAAMIIPMLFGSGIRFKALDAFVRGVPVVSTPLGVEGLGLEKLNVCMIPQDIEEMPELIASILDVEVNRYYSSKGKKFFSEKFEDRQVCNVYDSVLENP